MNFNKKHMIGVTICLTMMILGISTVTAVSAYNSPERVAYRAAAARQEAMQDGCERIAEKVTSCYTGEKTACSELQESNAWFLNEYGEYPELACPNVYDPLELGA